MHWYGNDFPRDFWARTFSPNRVSMTTVLHNDCVAYSDSWVTLQKDVFLNSDYDNVFNAGADWLPLQFEMKCCKTLPFLGWKICMIWYDHRLSIHHSSAFLTMHIIGQVCSEPPTSPFPWWSVSDITANLTLSMMVSTLNPQWRQARVALVRMNGSEFPFWFVAIFDFNFLFLILQMLETFMQSILPLS